MITPLNWVEKHSSCQFCGMFYEPKLFFSSLSSGNIWAVGLDLATTVLFSDVAGLRTMALKDSA